MRRAWGLEQRGLVMVNRALFFPFEVDPVNTHNGIMSFRVFGNHPAQHRKAPLKDRPSGAEVLALLGDDESQVVRGVLRVGTHGLRYADAELRSFSLSDWAGLTAIQTKRVNQGLDDLLFGIISPRHGSNLGGYAARFLHPLRQSAPSEPGLG